MSRKKFLERVIPLFLFSLKVNIVVFVVDFVFSLVLVMWQWIDITGIIGLMDNLLFLEGGLILLAGGASETTSTPSFHKIRESVFRTSEKWTLTTYEKGRQKALQYISAGSLLVVESILLALII